MNSELLYVLGPETRRSQIFTIHASPSETGMNISWWTPAAETDLKDPGQHAGSVRAHPPHFL